LRQSNSVSCLTRFCTFHKGDVFSLQTLSAFLLCPRASLEAGSYCSKGLTDGQRSLLLCTFINMNSLQQIDYPS